MAPVESDKRMSHQQNTIIQEELHLQFDEAILRGDLPDAARVVDALKEGGFAYAEQQEELYATQARHGDNPQDWDDQFSGLRYA